VIGFTAVFEERGLFKTVGRRIIESRFVVRPTKCLKYHDNLLHFVMVCTACRAAIRQARGRWFATRVASRMSGRCIIPDIGSRDLLTEVWVTGVASISQLVGLLGTLGYHAANSIRAHTVEIDLQGPGHCGHPIIKHAPMSHPNRCSPRCSQNPWGATYGPRQLSSHRYSSHQFAVRAPEKPGRTSVSIPGATRKTARS